MASSYDPNYDPNSQNYAYGGDNHELDLSDPFQSDPQARGGELGTHQQSTAYITDDQFFHNDISPTQFGRYPHLFSATFSAPVDFVIDEDRPFENSQMAYTRPADGTDFVDNIIVQPSTADRQVAGYYPQIAARPFFTADQQISGYFPQTTAQPSSQIAGPSQMVGPQASSQMAGFSDHVSVYVLFAYLKSMTPTRK
jgi:hypothetical protein